MPVCERCNAVINIVDGQPVYTSKDDAAQVCSGCALELSVLAHFDRS